MSYEAVLSPIRLGGVEIPNRVVRAAHLTQFSRRGQVSDQFVAYHEARARGGVGLTILESASVDQAISPAPLDASNDQIIDGWGRVAEAVHGQGMRVFAQLFHGGNQFDPLDGSAPWSASTIAGWTLGVPAQEMTPAMIEHVVDAFAAAARRAEASGLDGVELHGAHGYLLAQFLSPLTNRRSDDFGGSLENRLRFPLAVLDAVRDAVSPGYPVGIRLSGNEQLPGGLDNADCVEIARRVSESGLVDFLDLSAGVYQSMNKMIGPVDEPHGYELPDSIAITRAVDTPTIVTGRILTLAEADAIVARGDADMVSMVRATIADPNLVVRAERGEVPRPCIGCLQGCFGGLFERELGCTVNATVSREARIDDADLGRAAAARRVLVVGGGPAGLELARVAASRGHDVVLYERSSDLGGQLSLARRTPGRDDMGLIVDWLVSELDRLGVEVHLGSEIDATSPATIGRFDVAALAGGPIPGDPIQLGRPAVSLQSTDATRLLSSWEVFGEQAPPLSGPVVVLDDVGHMEGVVVAQHLVDSGCDVTVVTRFEGMANRIAPDWSTWSARQHLARADVAVRGRAYLAEVGDGVVTIGCLDGGSDTTVRAAAVVHISHHQPNLELAALLGDVADVVHVVGDARTQRFLTAAIRDGFELGMKI